MVGDGAGVRVLRFNVFSNKRIGKIVVALLEYVVVLVFEFTCF